VTTFKLNGLDESVDVEPDTPLIYVLRNDFQCHGAKVGCGLEQCGACVVLVDDEPAYACTTRIADVGGTNVRTIEGLADEQGNLDPVQAAFVELNAAQCGYCTAGIIMRVTALLDAEQHPSHVEILDALDGHLCRCGAHPRILAAVERAIAIRHERAIAVHEGRTE
jgi:aerobic-type carbon monoxide dehydrogenase small subunit (CoxS/CutS family)